MGLEQLLIRIEDKLDKVIARVGDNSERLARLEEREKARARDAEAATERFQEGDQTFSQLVKQSQDHATRLGRLEERGRDVGTKVWDVMKILFTVLATFLATMLLQTVLEWVRRA